ncbi:MAG: glycoside hydrolase family 3 C-terminal domain-containing protein [Chloroflexi bacterium]|nr:glycoside hydrolase family 3 C-terminal domain-containing protein [Chloroflexota bacterium]
MIQAAHADKTLYKDAAFSPAERARDLLARMTLVDKVAQLGSRWVWELQDEQGLAIDKAAELIGGGIGEITRVGGGSTLEPNDTARMANAIQDYLVNRTRLGIPAIIHEECCSGYLALGATCFPQIIGLASTWEPALAEQMTSVIRMQMRAVGAHQGLSPVLDIARDPRWGRVEETFGEDPLLATHMGMAYVRGLQGSDLRQGVMATGKHFVGYSLSEGGLNCTPVHLGPRELRQVWLMPFQAAILETGLASIMNSYSELDGLPVAASRAILTDLLRGELGFDGLVVADYKAISMLRDTHHVAADAAAAARLALNAGIDVELPTTDCYGSPLLQAVQAGSISEAWVDTAVERILRKKFELGLFEHPYVDVDRVREVFETPAQRGLARQIAAQSIVLLKNDDGVLPLPKTLGTLAVVGPNANQARHLLGDYSHPAHIEYLLEMNPALAAVFKWDPHAGGIVDGSVQVPTVLDAVRDRVSPGTRVLYAAGCSVAGQDRSGLDEAVQAARASDAVILVLGDKSGLTPDCTCGESRDRVDLGLPGVQQELAEAIVAVGRPTVVVLVNGRPLAIPWIAEHVPAVVEAWLPGEEGGAAIVDVVFGDVNPAGKLPMTFPRSVGQVPIFYGHKPSGGRSQLPGDYAAPPPTPLFPFGHGLSYTTFEYANLRIEPAHVERDTRVSIRVDVKNAGALAGDEVAQLYVCDQVASVPRPVKELKAFRRVHLEPGDTRTVHFELPVDLLAFYDETMQLVVEPGAIRVMVGSSSQDIRLESSFEIAANEKWTVARRVFAGVSRIEDTDHSG